MQSFCAAPRASCIAERRGRALSSREPSASCRCSLGGPPPACASRADVFTKNTASCCPDRRMPVYSQRLGGPPPADAAHGIVPCNLPCVAFHRRTTRASSVYTRTIGILPMFAWRASARVREPGIHAQQLGGAALWRDEGGLPGHRSEQSGRLGERGSPSSLTISTSRPASAGVRGVRPVRCRLAVFTRTIGVRHVAAAAGKTACRSSRF